MAKKEVSLPFDKIRDPQTITKVVSDAFKEQGLDVHANECEQVDDHSSQRRIYKIKSRKFFGPWSHRG